jgi:hypothetical protein
VRTHDRALLLVGVLAAVSAGACSLLVSTDGLTGVTPPPAVPDAGGDGTTADSGHDAGGCDAGFCACAAGVHSFCDDFDSVPTGAAWMFHQDPSGTLSYQNNGTFSPPISVFATSNARTNGDVQESLDLIETPRVTRLRVEVDMAIELGDPTNVSDGTHGFCPLSITLQPGEQSMRLNLYAQNADLEQLSMLSSVADQGVAVPTGTGARARYGVWFDAKARTCGVTVDGVEKLPDCVLHPAITGGSASLSLGVNFVRSPTKAWQVRMDNVTLDHD